MTKLSPIIQKLDYLLPSERVKDYPNAYNGLQLENNGSISQVLGAVDACEAIIEEAPENSLLIVHHGLFWNPNPRLVGAHYRKIKMALQKNIAVYSSHLPLDLHPQYGNNVLLTKALGLRKVKPSPLISASLFGYTGEAGGIMRDQFLKKIEAATGFPVHYAPGKRVSIERVLVITGSAGNEVLTAANLGYDTLVTGEGPHWSYTMAEELGINLIYAGHYATETFGVKALASSIGEEYGITAGFIPHPTGL